MTGIDPETRLAREKLLVAYRNEKSWSKVARKIGANKGLISRVAKGQKRAPNSLLAKLNLPMRTVAVAPCLHCGQVHIAKRCTQNKPRKPSKPKLNRKKVVTKILGVLWGGR